MWWYIIVYSECTFILLILYLVTYNWTKGNECNMLGLAFYSYGQNKYFTT